MCQRRCATAPSRRSKARSGNGPRALELAEEASRLAAATDALTLRADTEVVRAEVLRLLGQTIDVPEPLREALELYVQKGHVVGAERVQAGSQWAPRRNSLRRSAGAAHPGRHGAGTVGSDHARADLARAGRHGRERADGDVECSSMSFDERTTAGLVAGRLARAA